MNLLRLMQHALIAVTATLLIVACTKTEGALGDEASCDLYLKGLNQNCVGETCTYTATLEDNTGNGEFDMEVNKATFEHYKAVAEEKGANVCWEGEIE